jgi:hypothetical protein
MIRPKKDKDMRKPAILPAIAMCLIWYGTAFAGNVATPGPNGAHSTVNDGYVYNVWYDGRDDVRDFPNNGFFPGDFAANPPAAAFSAAGIFGNMFRPVEPSYVDYGSCARRHRYDKTINRCVPLSYRR